MQLVSVAHASHLARRALQRFPLVLLAAFGAAGIALAMRPAAPRSHELARHDPGRSHRGVRLEAHVLAGID